jgi:hypothetical protein
MVRRLNHRFRAEELFDYLNLIFRIADILRTQKAKGNHNGGVSKNFYS